MIAEQSIIDKIEETFSRLGIPSSQITIPNLSGKLFELYSLVDVIKDLEGRGFSLALISPTHNVQFANKPSKIDRE
ncbi:MAG: hypothetical protein Q9M89_08305 [Persephonella sp.]|nr:hypothetical protein [Persephonella sp.]